MTPIKIIVGNTEVSAELNESKTADLIINALPIESRVNTWGEEIYFTIPVKMGEESATMELKVGNLGYWPVGSAFCIFFGKTPASSDNKPVPASPVNIIGKMTCNLEPLFLINTGEKIRIELA